jgi:hypothetical protein
MINTETSPVALPETLVDNTKRARTIKPRPRKCKCGCEGVTKGGRFLPGHDATLKSRLFKRAVKTGVRAEQAVQRLREFNWPLPVRLIKGGMTAD